MAGEVNSLDLLDKESALNTSYSGGDSPEDHQDGFFDYVVLYLKWGNTAVEVVFLYVVLVNWLQRNKNMQSVFFVLFTLRVFVDLLNRGYSMAMYGSAEGLDADKQLLGLVSTLFFAFCINFDILCQLLISVNRFTALVYPFQYSNIWTTHGSVASIVLLFGVSASLVYPDYLSPLSLDIFRIVVSLVSLLLVVIPVKQRARDAVNSQQQEKNRKQNCQLLHEAILTAATKVLINAAFIFLDTQGDAAVPESSFHLCMYYFYYIANSVYMSLAILFLFCISAVAKRGLVLAFRPVCCKGSKVRNDTTSILVTISTRKI